AAFFTLTGKNDNALCSVPALKMLQDAHPAEVIEAVNNLLAAQGLTLADIDVLLCGMSGDVNHRAVYDELLKNADEATSVAAFKHLCGEYDTSSGFAIWLATKLFETQHLPEVLAVRKGSRKGIRNILLVNHYILNSHSVILLQN